MQQGSLLVGAIFVLVILAALAAFITSLSGTQAATAMLSVQGERASYAARAGMEWAITDIVNNSAAGLDCTGGSTGLALTEGALDGFSVSVTCNAVPVTEGAASYTVYELEAAASLGSIGRPDYVQRQLQARIAI